MKKFIFTAIIIVLALSSMVFMPLEKAYAATYDAGTGVLFVPDIALGTVHYEATLVKGDGWVFTLTSAAQTTDQGASSLGGISPSNEPHPRSIQFA